MTGLGSVVVGYRPFDRRRHKLADDFGIHAVKAGKCVAGCGYPVYYCSGGIDAVRDRDAQVMCDDCYQRYRDQVIEEL